MPSISVVLPIYNVEKYLRQCIDSVLHQTFQDFEVICVNDGSTDSCKQILKEYAKKDTRIKIINQKNQGLSCSRNNGLKKATGKYIYFLDSDDTIHLQLFEICHYFLEKTGADLVCFNFIHTKSGFVPNHQNYIPAQIPFKFTNNPLYFQQKRDKWKIAVNAWSKFYKKDFIKQFSFIPHICYEDYPHTYAILAKHPNTIILKTPLYFYTYNPNSISNRKFTIKDIKDYTAGLKSVYSLYQSRAPKEWRFVLKNLFPNILKQQLNKIKRSSKKEQELLFNAFATELSLLNQLNCISWRGHKLSRYFLYKKLIRNL